MSLILAALLAAAAPQQAKESETCPATAFTLNKPAATTAPKPQPKPKIVTPRDAHPEQQATLKKTDDCLAAKPKEKKGG